VVVGVAGLIICWYKTLWGDQKDELEENNGFFIGPCWVR
jgi:hypothetical protein